MCYNQSISRTYFRGDDVRASAREILGTRSGGILFFRDAAVAAELVKLGLTVKQ